MSREEKAKRNGRVRKKMNGLGGRENCWDMYKTTLVEAEQLFSIGLRRAAAQYWTAHACKLAALRDGQ